MVAGDIATFTIEESWVNTLTSDQKELGEAKKNTLRMALAKYDERLRPRDQLLLDLWCEEAERVAESDDESAIERCHKAIMRILGKALGWDFLLGPTFVIG